MPLLYPKMNHARTLTDLGGIWRFKLGDETEPGVIWNSPAGNGADLRSGFL